MTTRQRASAARRDPSHTVGDQPANALSASELVEFGSAVREFLAKHSPEAKVRMVSDSALGHDPVVWSAMADELQLAGLGIPEAYGGAGAGPTEQGVVWGELGRALACVPAFSTLGLAAPLLLASGDTAAKEYYLPGIAAGTTIATVALSEDSGRWDETGVQLAARQDNGQWRLSGHKNYVLDGHCAHVVFVVARTEAGLGVFAVPEGADGLAVTPLEVMDRTRRQARLVFDGVTADPVGDIGRGWAAVEAMLTSAAVALAAEQLGAAEYCLNAAVEYVKNRRQFGRPVGSFQAIKHKCADLALAVAGARDIVAYAQRCLAERNPHAAAMANMAKAYCSEVFVTVAAESIQLHGGIGFTWEHHCHLYLRRAQSSAQLLGSPSQHRDVMLSRLGFPKSTVPQC